MSDSTRLTEPLLPGGRPPLPTPSQPRVVANPLVVGGSYYPYEVSETFDCRICGSGQMEKNDPLIAPCDCAGGLSLVHKSCLLRWIELRPQQSIRSPNLLINNGPPPNANNQSPAARAAAAQNNLLLSVGVMQSGGGAIPTPSNDAAGNPLTNPRLQCEICLAPYRIVLVPRFVCSISTLCKCRTIRYFLEGVLLVCCVALTVVLMLLVTPTLRSNDSSGNPCKPNNSTDTTDDNSDCDDDDAPSSSSSPSSLITIWTLFGVTLVISVFAMRKIVLRFLRSSSVLELEGVGDETNFPFGRPTFAGGIVGDRSASGRRGPPTPGVARNAGGGAVPGGVDPDSSVAGVLITEGEEGDEDDVGEAREDSSFLATNRYHSTRSFDEV